MRNLSKEPPSSDFTEKELFNLDDTGEIFNLKRLLDSYGIPPEIQENRKFVFSLYALTKKQVQDKLGAIWHVEEKFGKNNCLIYQLYIFPDKVYLCLYGEDDECFGPYLFT